MNAQQFLKLLSTHDWYYNYSDDHSVWRRGQAERSAISNAMTDNEELKAVYKQYREETGM
jgi:hypothetical protein